MANSQVVYERLTMRRCMTDACDANAFADWDNLDPVSSETIIRRMERSCYGRTITSCMRDGIDRLWTNKQFCERYSTECYRIIAGLMPSNNGGVKVVSYLLAELTAGRIAPEIVADLSNYDICPAASQTERDHIDLRRNVHLEVKVSHSYTCAKCGKKETTSREYQARSADEPATISIKCLKCNHTWRK